MEPKTISGKEPGFCPDCGSVLPHKNVRQVTCYSCSHVFDTKVFGCTESRYVIHFNSYTKRKNTNEGSEETEGPLVDRMCPSCGNDKMSYATLQLRSADEGRTVFYTCTKCKYTENENS